MYIILISLFIYYINEINFDKNEKRNKELKKIKKKEIKKYISHNFKIYIKKKKNRISKFIGYLRNFYSRTLT